MTGIVEVDTDALNRLAEQIRQAAAHAQAASSRNGPLPAGLPGLVSPGLIQALAAFLENWRAPLADIVAEANRLADAITLLAHSYQDAELVVTHGIRS